MNPPLHGLHDLNSTSVQFPERSLTEPFRSCTLHFSIRQKKTQKCASNSDEEARDDN